jgi:hypothetical protein
MAVMLVPFLRNWLMETASQWRRVYFIPAVVGIIVSLIALLFARETDAFIESRIRYLRMSEAEIEAEKRKAMILQEETIAECERIGAILEELAEKGKSPIYRFYVDRYWVVLKETYKDYANKEIKYEISYSKVFGGDSKELKYKGKYTVYNADDSTEEKSTEDGIIKLKPTQKAVLDKIPVKTNIKVVAKLDEKVILSSVRTTTQFSYTKESKSILGEITKNSNVVQFFVGTETDTEKDKENLNNEDIVDITGEEPPKYGQPEKLNDTLQNKEYDNVPSTGDANNYIMWLTMFGVSLVLVFISGIVLIKSRF